MTSALIEAIGNTEYWFDALDQYQGEEADRIAWLAGEWTSYGDDLTEAERHWNLQAATALVREWKARRNIADLAASVERELLEAVNPITPKHAA